MTLAKIASLKSFRPPADASAHHRIIDDARAAIHREPRGEPAPLGASLDGYDRIHR
jgi:hypothetical protein